MQFLTVNDVTLHYRLIDGPAGRPAIVFINSLGTDFRIWREVVGHLAGDFPVVTYDKRGHGLSDLGQVPYSIEDHALDLAALLDRLNVRDAVICGLSVGGLIAQALVVRRPDLVKGLVLCDTAHKIGTADGWNSRIATVERDGIEAIADGIMKVWFTPDFHAGRPADLAGCRNMLTRQSPVGYAATCAALRDADLTESTKRIDLPTLCVVGDQDGSTPPDLVLSMSKLIRGASYKVIENAGHIPCVEQPAALAEMIRDFIDTLPSRGKLHA